MSRFSAPLLEPRDLVQSLERIYKLTEGDIRQPKAEVMAKFYEAAVLHIVGPPRDSQWSYGMLAQMENPDWLHDPIQRLRFFHHVRDFFSLIGEAIPLSLKDLLQPDAKRTRRLLSSLVNFIRHMEQYEHVVAGHMSEQQELAREEQEVDGALEERVQTLCTLESQRASEAGAVEALKREEWTAARTVEERLRQWEAAKEEVARKKERIQQLNEDITAEKEAANRVRGEVAQLRQRIVASPDRLRAHVNDLERHIEMEEERKAERKEELKRRGGRVETVRKVLSELTNRMELLEAADSYSQESSRIKIEVKSARERLESVQERVEGLRRSIQADEEMAKQQQRKSAARLEGLRQRQAELEAAMRKVEGEEEKEKGMQREREREMESIQTEIDTIHGAMRSMEERHRNEAARLEAVRKAILHKVQYFQEEVESLALTHSQA